MPHLQCAAFAKAANRIGVRACKVPCGAEGHATRAFTDGVVVLRGCRATRSRFELTNLAIFTPDTSNPHKSGTTSNGLQLIKGEFGVGHGSVCDWW